MQNSESRIQNSEGRLGFSESVGFNAECAEGSRGDRQPSIPGIWNMELGIRAKRASEPMKFEMGKYSGFPVRRPVLRSLGEGGSWSKGVIEGGRDAEEASRLSGKQRFL
jgi:hypothetical protein